jgi:cellulose synthase/poly-beta-1,6-N-acetylglucosamine synthase-like glycosyltransferase
VATWLVHTLAARRGIPQIADLTQPEYAVAAGTPLPRVSIVVAARNEAAMIESAVRSLLTIDYPDYELIVVDDRSEDATGEILERLKAEIGTRLVAVHVRELPAGWLGKTHAMWRAAREATGEWILFSDADVVHAPQALRRAVHYAEQERAGHMVLFPTMLMNPSANA